MGYNPDSSRYALPRGRVFFARKNLTTGVLDTMLYLGNAPQFEFNQIGDDIDEIMDWTSNSSSPSARITKKRVPEFGLKLMEVNPDNLALAVMGSVPSDYTQGGTSVTNEAIGKAKTGGIYQLANRGVAGGTQLSALTVKKGATTFTAGTNYVFRDTTNGIIEVILLPAGVVDGDAITADYTCPAITSGVKKVLGGTVPRIEGKLLYIGSSVVGPVHQVTIWNCSLAADGGFPWIAQDHVEFGLKVNVLTDPSHTELFEILEVEVS